uniref:Integrase catalytic domain-containing protein n=1 Tax=Nicotiana tabacum TaxID=4097 RepID=A0A1S4ANV2_TOBAC|nr:PREDICTED: uncharacterized protein LOC107799738 [Nicotiana tabacum]
MESRVTYIRSNHGTKFDYAKFDEFCYENDITHNFSAPRTPQQNGVVERKNKTLEEMVRTMLIDSGIAKNFWAEAVNIACYLVNRFQSNPKESNFKEAKRILRYLEGTQDLVLFYPSGASFNLIGYADTDFAGYLVDRKITSRMAHFLAHVSSLGSQGSKTQWLFQQLK